MPGLTKLFKSQVLSKGQGPEMELVREKWVGRIVVVLILVGIFLRVNRYLCNFPFWGDEAWLVWDTTQRSFAEILSNVRVATNFSEPAPGFMLVERFLIALFGIGEQVFRFFPCACGVASVFLFKRLLKDVTIPPVMLMALTIFVFAPSLIFYSSELKQYSSDLLVTIIIYLIHFRAVKSGMDKKDTVSLVAAGLVGLFFVLPCILVLCGIALAQIAIYFKRHQVANMRQYGLVLGVWLMGFAAMWFGYYHVNFDSAVMEYQKQYYLALSLTPGDWAEFFRKLFAVFEDPIGLTWPWLSFAMFGVGCCSLWRGKKDLLLPLIMPIGLTISLSMAKHYPFYGRFLIFLLPAFFILIAQGVDYLKNGRLWRRILGGLILATLLVQPLAHARNYVVPSSFSDIRSLMLYMQTNQKPGDGIYMNNDTRWGYYYYYIVLGFHKLKTKGILYEHATYFDKPGQLFCVVSPDGREWGNVYAWDHVLDEEGRVTRLPGGGRTWVLLSQVGGPTVEQHFSSCFDAFGKRLDEKHSQNAVLYLYDLK